MLPSRLRPPVTRSGLYVGIAATCCLLLFLAYHQAGGRQLHTAVIRTTQTSSQWLPPLRSRDDLAGILQAEGKQVGVELGVQRGHFSAKLLTAWKTCRTIYLVDIWRAQANYKDVANVDNAQQEAILAEAKRNHQLHAGKSVFVRNLTTEASSIITEPLDFAYVDARHDYCGAIADIAAYWPKLKRGAIMAGHDYLTSSEVKAIDPAQDWSLCIDGSVQETAVKGAVNDFFRPRGVPVHVTYADGPWPTWFVRKP